MGSRSPPESLVLASSSTSSPSQSLSICSQKEMSPDGPATVTWPWAWLHPKQGGMENLIHTSFPPLQVSFGPLMGIYYFLNTLNWTVRSIIQLLLKNLAFTFSGGGSSDSQIQVSYKNSSLVSINTRFYCPLLHELHTASAFSIPELFLAFNPFQIEEPSNLLFFFFFLFCAEENPSIFSDCGWVVFRNWAGLFEKWPFLWLSLRFHTQVWASGLVLTLVCVFLNGSSYRKVAEVSLAGPEEEDRSWTPPTEMMTWPWPGKGTTYPDVFELPTSLKKCQVTKFRSEFGIEVSSRSLPPVTTSYSLHSRVKNFSGLLGAEKGGNGGSLVNG